MLVQVARVSAVGAWTALAVAIVWGFGLGYGSARPPAALYTLACTGVGLLWLRVVALWAAKVVRRRRRRRVSLTKDAEPFRPRVPSTFDAAPWVYTRQVAVLLLLPLAAALPGALYEADGGEAIRELKSAGAVLVSATVIGVTDAHGVEDVDGTVTHYEADLELALPDGRRITARGAGTYREPRPDDRIQALWAPSAPQLGAQVRLGNLAEYVDTRWTVRGERLFLLLFYGVVFLCFIVPFLASAEADGLHDVAWRPLAQTALPVLATLLLLWIRPQLTGVDIGGIGSIAVAAYGGFAIPLLLLFTGLALRALLD